MSLSLFFGGVKPSATQKTNIFIHTLAIHNVANFCRALSVAFKVSFEIPAVCPVQHQKFGATPNLSPSIVYHCHSVLSAWHQVWENQFCTPKSTSGPPSLVFSLNRRASNVVRFLHRGCSTPLISVFPIPNLFQLFPPRRLLSKIPSLPLLPDNYIQWQSVT